MADSDGERTPANFASLTARLARLERLERAHSKTDDGSDGDGGHGDGGHGDGGHGDGGHGGGGYPPLPHFPLANPAPLGLIGFGIVSWLGGVTKLVGDSAAKTDGLLSFTGMFVPLALPRLTCAARS
jgi:hypothetical protein